jgi:hypothetical protein
VYKPATRRAERGNDLTGRDESFLYECPTITRFLEPGAAAGARGTGPCGLTVIPCGEGPAATTPASTAATTAIDTAKTITPRRLPTLRSLITNNSCPGPLSGGVQQQVLPLFDRRSKTLKGYSAVSARDR